MLRTSTLAIFASFAVSTLSIPLHKRQETPTIIPSYSTYTQVACTSFLLHFSIPVPDFSLLSPFFRAGYSSNTLPNLLSSTALLSVADCIDSCTASGSTTCGISGSGACFGGGEVESVYRQTGAPVDASECASPCNADASIACGGDNVVVYTLTSSLSVPFSFSRLPS
jgi:hypothetical protein